MPSSYTPRLRLEMQAAGENLNTWGAPKLNTVINRLDFAVAGWTNKTLTADYALTSSNSDDEARTAMIKFIGTGGYTVTIPSVGKRYDIYNALTGSLIITTGAGDSASLAAGEIASVVCDGSNVYKVIVTDMSGLRLTNGADPVNPQDLATKAYADALAFTANSGVLPAQTGNSGKFITTNGTVASWAAPTVASISDYASDQATKTAAATKLAISYAVSL